MKKSHYPRSPYPGSPSFPIIVVVGLSPRSQIWWLNNYGYHGLICHLILVGGWATPLKNMSSSIGMMKFPIYGKIKNGNQTTNQQWIDLSSHCSDWIARIHQAERRYYMILPYGHLRSFDHSWAQCPLLIILRFIGMDSGVCQMLPVSVSN